jgi:hypothetical protein
MNDIRRMQQQKQNKEKFRRIYWCIDLFRRNSAGTFCFVFVFIANLTHISYCNCEGVLRQYIQLRYPPFAHYSNCCLHLFVCLFFVCREMGFCISVDAVAPHRNSPIPFGIVVVLVEIYRFTWSEWDMSLVGARGRQTKTFSIFSKTYRLHGHT